MTLNSCTTKISHLLNEILNFKYVQFFFDGGGGGIQIPNYTDKNISTSIIQNYISIFALSLKLHMTENLSLLGEKKKLRLEMREKKVNYPKIVSLPLVEN